MELIENKDLFQTVFNSSSNGIALLQALYNEQGKTEDFSILLFNAYTFKWIGAIDYKGKRYSELFPMVKETGILDKFIEVAETGVTATFEKWYTGEGLQHWFRFTAVKQAELLVVTTEDITEAKQTEINLKNALDDAQKQKRLYDSITNNTPDLVYVFSLSYKFIYANKALLTMWGKSEQDAIGRGLRENGYEEWHAKMHEQEIDEVVATKKIVRGTVSFPHAELGRRIYDYILVPVVNEQGDVEAIAGTTRDITEIKRAEELLQQSETRFRNMIEQAPVALLLSRGEDVVIESINKPMLEFMNKKSQEEVLGKKMVETLPELADQQALQNVIQVQKTGVPFRGDDQPVDLIINGKLERRYFNFSYDRITESGESSAVLHMAVDVTEQLLSRRKIEDNEKRFRSLIEEAPVGTCLYVGPDMRIEIANKIIMDQWGRGPEIIGKNMLDVFPEAKSQPFPEILKEVYRTGKQYEEKGARADININGVLTTFYVDFTYKPLFDETGSVYAILDVVIDVTSQVKANRLLEENQEFIRKIFYSSPVANLVYVGEEMILREANEKMLEIFGRDASIIGKPVMETIPELNKTDLFEKYSYVLESGETYQAFAQYIEFIKNGTSYFGYYDYTYKPLCDDNDKAYGVICIVIEVTDQVYARQKQQEAESGLRGAVELAQLGTWSIDVATNGLVYSDRLIEWFGFDPNNKDYNEVIPILAEGDQQRVTKALAWAFKPESGGIYDETYTVIHPKTGFRRILHAQGKTVFDRMGNPVRMNGTAQDVTLQHEVQTALEQQVLVRTEQLAAAVDELGHTNNNLEKSNMRLLQSNEELAQFAYIASHDLQEPLRKIITFSGLLDTSLGENKTAGVQNYMDKIVHASMRMRSLISDVLNYSQLAKSDEQFIEVNLNDIVTHLVMDYDLLIEQKRAKVYIEGLPIIKANEVQMTQLFRNLIGNALKFTQKDRDPVISVTAETILLCGIHKIQTGSAETEFCKIQIRDNGIGFEPEYFERIFNIFQRLHSKTIYEGTGIGLAMCKKIVQNHGGDIFAESVFGEGAVFTILLPNSKE
ncbi:PAS domain-containing protein [Flavobacterium sp. ENC]|uniref:PAS domain-containing sensor histidine kinase n=1 Tax=Flavobacterium sp. ENC TaxID=2897330 RepID=UPI001E3D138E|nr:PAS domain-containing protein [Flavobacterium sp. ENC]MCD0467285.1 PAS domain-containing protein [Flavobacterium sp. ENC]